MVFLLKQRQSSKMCVIEETFRIQKAKYNIKLIIAWDLELLSLMASFSDFLMKIKQCWLSMIPFLKSRVNLSTGRSMGCRAAAALARQLSDESDEPLLLGVICLSFPLHPPGQAHGHQQRGEDLRALPRHMSVLFVSGTEDTMCNRVSERFLCSCWNLIP